MCSEKDICVRVYVNGSDWVGLDALAKFHGVSHGALLRTMLRHAIEYHARDQFARNEYKPERVNLDSK